MPETGSDDGARIISWLKGPGAPVEADEPICMVRVGDLTAEIVSPSAGVVGGIYADTGQLVPPGGSLAEILPALTRHEPEPEVEPDLPVPAEPVAEPEPVGDAEPEPVGDPGPVGDAELGRAADLQPVGDVESQPDAVPLGDPEPVGDAEPEPVAPLEPAADPEPEPLADLEPIAEADPDPAAPEPEPEPWLEPEPEPDLPVFAEPALAVTSGAESDVPRPGPEPLDPLANLASEIEALEIAVPDLELVVPPAPEPEPEPSAEPEPEPIEIHEAASEPRAPAALEPPPPVELAGFRSPAVRRLAEQHGLDLDAIEGTGRAGRVTRDDVLAAL